MRLLELLALACAASGLVTLPPKVPRKACAARPKTKQDVSGRGRVARRGALDDLVATAEAFLGRLGAPAASAYNASLVKPGVVSRCAAKRKEFSRAKGWTTLKPSLPGFMIGPTGCGDDFNHYRTNALNGTADRAVSILTVDVARGVAVSSTGVKKQRSRKYATQVVQRLRGEGWPVNDGDLGENIYVAGMPYETFGIGRRFQLGTAVVQITEAIVPCAYLCTLDYLAVAKWRCQDFIRTLANRRGWYARVLTPGAVNVGDPVMALP